MMRQVEQDSTSVAKSSFQDFPDGYVTHQAAKTSQSEPLMDIYETRDKFAIDTDVSVKTVVL